MPAFSTRRYAFPTLWLLIALAYGLAKVCVDQITFGHSPPLSSLGEMLFVASGQALVYRAITQRRH